MLSLPTFESRDARIAHYEDVIEFLAPIFAQQSRDHWCAELTRLEVPHAPVRTSTEVVDSAQAKALGLVLEDPAGPFGAFRTIRSPLSFDGARATAVTAPPSLGQHDNVWKKG
jgi:crotonobetainyl-CoA:carnitine CoA-transferase CaiB-like acyl-CoA transferase